MQKATRFLQERKSGPYIPGNRLVEYYHTTLSEYPRLKEHQHPLTELVNSIIKKITDKTENPVKLYKQIGALKQYFQILVSEVQIRPDIYPIDIGHINRHRGTLNNLTTEVKDLKNLKETNNKKKLISGFEKVEREFVPLIKEIQENVDACEGVSAELCQTLYE